MAALHPVTIGEGPPRERQGLCGSLRSAATRALRHDKRLLIAALVLAAASTVFFLARARPNGPRLNLPSDMILDLGQGKAGEVLAGDLTIANPGTEDLTFYCNPGCSCVKFDPKQGILPPGASLAVKVNLQLRTEGKDERIQTRIQTNGPASPAVVWIVAKCPAPIIAEPCLLDFGSVARGSSPTQQLRLSFPKLKERPELTNLAVRSDDERVSTQPVDTPGGLALAVSLNRSLPIGPHSSNLAMRYAGLEGEITVPIVANICGLFTVAPATLRLPPAAATDKGLPELKFLVWRADKRDPGIPKRILAPAGISVRRDTALVGTRAVFRVQCDATDAAASALDGQEIRIRFEGEDEEVRLRLRASLLRPEDDTN